MSMHAQLDAIECNSNHSVRISMSCSAGVRALLSQLEITIIHIFAENARTMLLRTRLMPASHQKLKVLKVIF
jgi:hypothetical protein